MINKIRKEFLRDDAFPRWFACSIFALCTLFASPAQAEAAIWFSDQQTIWQHPPADPPFLQTIPSGDIRELAADGKGGVWLATGSYLRHDGGSTPRQWTLDALGLSAARQLRADPWDASVWLTDGTRVLHLGPDGATLASFVPASPVHDMALAADQSVWLLDAGGALRHHDRRGLPLGNLALPESLRTTARHLAIDSLRARIWLWNAQQLVQLDLDTGMPQRSFSLPANSIATVLDARTGTLWTLSPAALTSLPATGFAVATDLRTFDITGPRALAWDAAGNCLWIGHADGVSRLDFPQGDPATPVVATAVATVAATVAATPASLIGTPPFAIRPSITLTAPAANDRATGITSLVLGVDALCPDSSCALPGDYLRGYRIDALLDGRSIGERFVFDAGSHTFRLVPVPALPAGAPSVFLAQAIDTFGHASNLIEETFDAAPAGAITNAAHTAPTVSITAPANNASAVAPATVVISANASATGATISKVNFYNGTTLLGTDSSAPYSFNWTGVAVGSYTLTAKATDSLGSVKTSAAVNITVTRAPPTVSITAPANNASLVAPASVAINASASATGATISKVQFYQGSTLLGTDTTAPYSFNWTGVAVGSYTLTAKATDSLGAVTTSAAVNITVTRAPPTVSITAPANNASLVAPASVAINASASATGATISKVQFYQGSTLLGTDTTAPYSFNWTGVAVGSYTLTAKATDSLGAASTSAPVAVKVTAATLPVITLSSPQSNAALVAPAALSVTASASSANGAIAKVEFFNGPVLLGSASAAPWSLALSGLASGNYLVTAKATDSAGFSATSAGLFFVVDSVDPCVAADAHAAALPVPAAAAADAARALAQRPLSFDLNQGQSPDAVKFLVRRPGYDFFLTGDGAVLGLHGARAVKGSANGLAQDDFALHLRFPGANPHALPTGLEPQAERSHYLSGSDPAQWRRDVPHFASVRYTGLYPGIDALWYGREGQLEYDLIVAPGADPGVIRLAVEGADAIVQDGNGDLQLHTPLGVVRKHRPVAWQDIDGARRAVDAGYTLLAANTIAIRIGEYDARHPLVIDPVLVYATFLDGGAGGSTPHAVALDRCGNLLVAGQTSAADFPVTPGAAGSAPHAGSGFIAKLDPLGRTLLYSTYLGGSGSAVNALALDAGGHAFVAGQSAGGAPVTPGSFQTGAGAATSSAFVARLSPDGRALLYGTYLGGAAATSQASGIAVDAAGNAFVTGSTSYGFPTTAGAVQPVFGSTGALWNSSPVNAFVAKLNPAGSALVYATFLGKDVSLGKRIAVDSTGSAFVAGETYTTGFAATPGAFQTTNSHGNQLWAGFVARLNPAGSALLYGTYVNLSNFTAGHTYLNGMALDDSGNVYVTGTTGDNAMGIASAYVVKLGSSGGSALYTQYFGGPRYFGGSVCYSYDCLPSRNSGEAIAVDRAGNAFVTGYTNSPNFPLVKPVPGFPAVLPVQGFQGQGAFLTKLNAAGDSLLWSTFIAGNPGKTSDASSATALALDAAGVVHVAGVTTATDFPVTPGVVQSTRGGASSMFVVKISDLDDISTVLSVSPAAAVTGQSITLTAAITGGLPNPGGSVVFYDGAVAIGSAVVSAGKATLSTSTLATGGHALTAAYGGDASHAASTSGAVNLYVSRPTTPPTVSLTAPVNGAVYAAGTPIVLTATADAANGMPITWVDFFQGTTWLGSNDARPSSVTWRNALPGSYVLSAWAKDSNGLGQYSSPVNITVAPPPGGVPMAPNIYSALAGAESATLSISAPLWVGSSPLTGYTATCSAAGAAAVSASAAAGTNIFSVSGMTGGITYSCSATASNTQGASLPGNSVSVTPTVDRFPQSVIAAPLDNSTVPVLGPVTISVTASSHVSTIALIEIWDNGSLLVGHVPAGAGAAYTFHFTWASRTAGSHRLFVRVTDALGSRLDRFVTVNAVAGPTVTLAADAIYYLAPAAVTLTAVPAVATGAGAGSIAKVDFYQGTSLLGSATAPPWTVRWTNVGVGSWPVGVTVTDSAGLTGTAAGTVNVLAAPGITPAPGLDGSSVNDDRVTISGQVQSAPNSAVDVNGLVGVIAPDGSFLVGNVPLKPGANTLTLTLTTADGAAVVKTLTVNSSGPALFRFEASPVGGFAPLTAGLALTQQGDPGTTAVTRIDVLCRDDGVVSITADTLEKVALNGCVFTEPGVYRIRVNVYGNAPNQGEQLMYTGTQNVHAVSVAYQDAMLRAVYRGMLDRLKAGNIAGALNAVTAGMHDKFSAIFTGIGANLGTMVDKLGVITDARISDTYAEYLVIRNTVPDGPTGYPIQFIRGEDGIWRIDGM